jgi:hypothetical protein
LRGFLLLIHIAAAAGGLASGWTVGAQAGFLLLVLANGAWAWRSLARQPTRILLEADGQLALALPPDEMRPSTAATAPLCLAHRLPGALALPWLCVFSWRETDAAPRRKPLQGTLVLLPDSVSEATLRPLVIWLRWQ